MSAIVSNTDFADISAFVSEVKKAFKTTIPPIVLSIDKRENIEPIAQQLQSDGGYLGKRVSCKHAKNGSFGTFSLNELYSFGEERYPILLSFKQLKECEDFANGWIRLSKIAERKKVEAEEAAQKKEEDERKRVEEERIQKERLQENLAKLGDLKKELKTTEDRIALIAEKYLDGELSKEEKQQLTERYSSRINMLRAQIKELDTYSVDNTPDLKEPIGEPNTLSNIIVQSASEPIHVTPVQKKKKSIVGKIVLGLFGVIAVISIVSYINSAIEERERQERIEYERTHPSNYKKLLDALESGKVKYGMTYSQIVSIVGEPNSVSRSGGVVQFAYYRRTSSIYSYDNAEIQLCFRNGKLYNWND